MSPGERARRQRKKAEAKAKYDADVAALRARGASCESCDHRRKYPHGNKQTCELDSDFDGYAMVEMTDVCPRWKARSSAHTGV